MKQHVREFFRRGLIACGFGPMVLAIFYLIFQKQTGMDTLSVNQVCLGIFSLSVLAFVAGGMNVIYQVERLPLMIAILIHGGVLYSIYLITYLINDWLEWGITPILFFSIIFILGYLAIWAAIYCTIKKKPEKLNHLLTEKQRNSEPPFSH